MSLTHDLWLPFLATAGASFTILVIQGLNRHRKEYKQRLYAVSYMADALYRLVQSELIIQKHTITPHIEAVKRILAGDRTLLELTFDTDEFDILSAGPIRFFKIPDDHKLLVGYDDIRIVQAFDSLLYFHTDDTNRQALRSFVALNLKSKKQFLDRKLEDQQDILNMYWDGLLALEHEGKRLVAFAFYIFSPALRTYAASRKFKFFKTKSIFKTLDRIACLRSEYNEFIPSQEFFAQSQDGGIQRAL